MSRIHEALGQVGRSRTGDETIDSHASPISLAEDLILDQYELESGPPPITPRPADKPRASAPLASTPADSVPWASAPDASGPSSSAPRPGPSKRRPLVFDPALTGKLVVTDTVLPGSVVEYRRLAGSLQQLQTARGLKALLVTSALPNDGKTLTVANLALTFSECFGRRVMIIDADHRQPSVHRVFGLPNNSGLSEFLRDGRNNIRVAQVSNHLSVLTAGSPDVNSTAALVSSRMRDLLEKAAGQVDWVLLDSAPVASMPNPQPLARMAGAVLFVIGAGSPYAVVSRAIAKMGRDRIVGTVLNRVAPADDVPCVAR